MQATLKPFFIGNVKIDPNLILAPMSGVTNTHFRRLIREENPKAVGLLVTEFISIEALTREARKSLERLRFEELERPISVQIFGFDIDRMVAAAQIVQNAGADIVDINCGCPAPKVVKKGGGCELMRNPDHLSQMLKAVRAVLSVPLTLKMRAGWSEDCRNAIEIAKIAEDAGVNMLAVHGRTRAEMYRGNCDWQIIGDVAKAVSIPVVGSGDVTCVSSASTALDSGVSGLMIGRAALQNPWIFSELVNQLRGVQWHSPRDLETVRVLERYRDMLVVDLSERAVLGKMKQFGSQITRRVRGAAEARKQLCTAKNLSEFNEALLRWKDTLASQADLDMYKEPACLFSGASAA